MEEEGRKDGDRGKAFLMRLQAARTPRNNMVEHRLRQAPTVRRWQAEDEAALANLAAADNRPANRAAGNNRPAKLRISSPRRPVPYSAAAKQAVLLTVLATVMGPGATPRVRNVPAPVSVPAPSTALARYGAEVPQQPYGPEASHAPALDIRDSVTWAPADSYWEEAGGWAAGAGAAGLAAAGGLALFGRRQRRLAGQQYETASRSRRPDPVVRDAGRMRLRSGRQL